VVLAFVVLVFFPERRLTFARRPLPSLLGSVGRKGEGAKGHPKAAPSRKRPSPRSMTNFVGFPFGLRVCRPLLVHGLPGAEHSVALAPKPPGAAPSDRHLPRPARVLILIGRLLGEAIQRMASFPSLGQLLAGICWGVSARYGCAGRQTGFPRCHRKKSMIDGISQFGILLHCLLTTGWDRSRVGQEVRRAAASISLTGLRCHSPAGSPLGWLLPNRCCRTRASAAHIDCPRRSPVDLLDQDRAAIVSRDEFTRPQSSGRLIVASAFMERYDRPGSSSPSPSGSPRPVRSISPRCLTCRTAVFLPREPHGRGRPDRLLFDRWANDNFTSDPR